MGSIKTPLNVVQLVVMALELGQEGQTARSPAERVTRRRKVLTRIVALFPNLEAFHLDAFSVRDWCIESNPLEMAQMLD